MTDRLRSRRGFLTSSALVAGTALAGCSSGGGGSASSDDTVKIGVIEDRSGNFALVGDPKHKALVQPLNDFCFRSRERSLRRI